MHSRHLLPLAALLFSAAYAALASETASVSGTVTDPSGAPVSAASITLHQIAGTALLTAASDRSGHFAFPDVAPGQYLLDGSGSGLTIAQSETLALTPGEAKNIAIHLVISAVKTQVTVTAAGEPQSVDQVSKALDILDAAEPERRGIFSVSDALRFLPGLRVSTLGGPAAYTTIQTRGLPADDTAVLMDGFRFRDPTSPQGDASAYIEDLLLVDTSRIEVLRGSGSSLYGTNSIGGTVNIITDPGGGPIHGDLDVQGGGLGLFRGVAHFAGGVLDNRLAYSAGVSHLNVTEGIDDAGAAREWSGQAGLNYSLTSKIRLGADVFANTGYLQINVIPSPTADAPTTGIIPAIPSVTFVPSLGDPDSARYAHFIDSLFRFDDEVNSRFSFRLAYAIVSSNRNNTDGPAGPGLYQPLFNTSDRYTGRIDTMQARANYLLGSHQILTAGYEFEREQYLNVASDQNPDPAQRAYSSTDARQQTNAVFAQDELRFFSGRLQVLLSGRFTQASLDQPAFFGAASPYTRLPSPPAAYTGDASLAYFVHSTSTKLRSHAGNSFRLPSLYERFGGYLFDGVDYAYGDPRLSPERAVSVDFGFDQYLFHDRLKLSATYFYSHLQQVIGFMDFPPGYLDPYGRTSGYYNTGGGISRGVELSGDFRPSRNTTLFASYSYTNAQDRTSQYYTGAAYSPLQSPFILPNMLTAVATQQLGERIDLGLDFEAGSKYLYPLYGYAYQFSGPRQLGLSAGYSVPFTDRISTRFYVRVSNALDQSFYEDGFRTPPRWAVAGIHFGF
ncbi:MAG: TonB-dependent receptor [Bryobacteraceae bacterium]